MKDYCKEKLLSYNVWDILCWLASNPRKKTHQSMAGEKTKRALIEELANSYQRIKACGQEIPLVL